MKKFSVLFLAMFLALSVISVNHAYAADNACAETVLDKTWDWYTTIGKSGMDKDQVLLKNKAERAQKCAEKMAKKAQKEAGEAAGDLKKKLGM